MERNPNALAITRFDVVVIGGGINGAAVAREAALRGLKVALVDAGDFASGTSSRSSKLIHGGLRYLEQFDFRLVRESRLERRLLRDVAPHLAQPLPFLLPIYEGDPFIPLKIRAGLTLYDWLGNLGRDDRHRMLTPQGVQKIFPALRADQLRAGAVYYDSATDDARLTLEMILDAAAHGAEVANYAEVLSFKTSAASGEIESAEVLDRRRGVRTLGAALGERHRTLGGSRARAPRGLRRLAHRAADQGHAPYSSAGIGDSRALRRNSRRANLSDDSVARLFAAGHHGRGL
jgi:glycerol-3-phosphate dehydrogenase